MFDFEFTGGTPATEVEKARGIEAARQYCQRQGIDPGAAYREALKASDTWPPTPQSREAESAW